MSNNFTFYNNFKFFNFNRRRKRHFNALLNIINLKRKDDKLGNTTIDYLKDTEDRIKFLQNVFRLDEIENNEESMFQAMKTRSKIYSKIDELGKSHAVLFASIEKTREKIESLEEKRLDIIESLEIFKKANEVMQREIKEYDNDLGPLLDKYLKTREKILCLEQKELDIMDSLVMSTKYKEIMEREIKDLQEREIKDLKTREKIESLEEKKLENMIGIWIFFSINIFHLFFLINLMKLEEKISGTNRS